MQINYIHCSWNWVK